MIEQLKRIDPFKDNGNKNPYITQGTTWQSFKEAYANYKREGKHKISKTTHRLFLDTFFYFLTRSIVLEGLIYDIPSLGKIGIVKYQASDYHKTIRQKRQDQYGVAFNTQTEKSLLRVQWRKPRRSRYHSSLGLTDFVANRTLKRTIADLLRDDPSMLNIYYDNTIY